MSHILNIDNKQVVTVSPLGGNFTDLQDAIDSISGETIDNQFVISVAPGTYTGNFVLKPFISIAPLNSNPNNVVLTSTSGTTLKIEGTGLVDLSFLRIESEPTVSGAKTLEIIDTDVTCVESLINMTSSTNGITGTLIDGSGAGSLLLGRSTIEYTMTGNDAGTTNTHNVMDASDTFSFLNNILEWNITVADENDDINFLNNNSAGTSVFASMIITGFTLSASYTGTVTCFHHKKSTVFSIEGFVIVSMIGAGSTGTANLFKIDTDTNNGFFVLNLVTADVLGYGSNYALDIATGDTALIEFCSLKAADGITGAGTSFGTYMDINGNLNTKDVGRIVNTTRITTADSPYTALVTDEIIFANPDTGAITINLPAGSGGKRYRITNTRVTGAANVIIDPAELIRGSIAVILKKGEEVDIVFNATEGWW